MTTTLELPRSARAKEIVRALGSVPESFARNGLVLSGQFIVDAWLGSEELGPLEVLAKRKLHFSNLPEYRRAREGLTENDARLERWPRRSFILRMDTIGDEIGNAKRDYFQSRIDRVMRSMATSASVRAGQRKATVLVSSRASLAITQGALAVFDGAKPRFNERALANSWSLTAHCAPDELLSAAVLMSVHAGFARKPEHVISAVGLSALDAAANGETSLGETKLEQWFGVRFNRDHKEAFDQLRSSGTSEITARIAPARAATLGHQGAISPLG